LCLFQLSDLYDLMENSSELIAVLPELATRLHSLKQLHEQAQQFIKELREVQSFQETVANGTVQNEKLLKGLQCELKDIVKNATVAK